MNKGGRPKGFLTKPEKYQYSKAYLRKVRSLQKKRDKEEEAKRVAEEEARKLRDAHNIYLNRTTNFNSEEVLGILNEDDNMNVEDQQLVVDENNVSGDEHVPTDDEDIELEPELLIEESLYDNALRELKDLYIDTRMTRKQGNGILNILRLFSTKYPQVFRPFPKDIRTVMKAPTYSKAKVVEPGTYIHTGVEACIDRIFTTNPHLPIPEQLILDFNIDGLPIAKSSSSSVWPIQCRIYNIPTCKPFVVGIYHGMSKPKNMHEYLHDFVDEMKRLVDEGIIINDKSLLVKIRAFICDAPARASIKCIKGHSGYFSCEKCKQEGEKERGTTMIFDKKTDELRTDEGFKNKDQIEHHTPGLTSPLLQIPKIEMVTQFPLDYMHLVLLGVQKRMLRLWINFKKKPWSMTPTNIKLCSEKLVFLSQYIPSEFSRKPRSLDELPRWKCTELRLFLFYLSPIILKEFIKPDYYEHFMTFQVAMTLLAREDLFCDDNIELAQNLINIFVPRLAYLYGREQIVYNVHSLLHLPADAKKFGVLDNFSAFPYENNLQEVKKSIKGYTKPLEQIVRIQYYRLGNEFQKAKVNIKYPQLVECRINNKAVFKNFTLSANTRDSIAMLKNGELVKVLNVLKKQGEDCILGEILNKTDEEFFIKPCAATVLDIFVIDMSLPTRRQYISLSSIKIKYLLLPFVEPKWVAIPLMHAHLS